MTDDGRPQTADGGRQLIGRERILINIVIGRNIISWKFESVKSDKGILKTIEVQFPPSEPCRCEICTDYCKRPGWWTVQEAGKVIEAGHAGRMMVEVSPERDFAVLSPAFKGNESNFALKEYASFGCTFFNDGLCELFGSGLQPLECRYCHHGRKNLGIRCHKAIEEQWKTPEAKRMIVRWGNLVGLWNRIGFNLIEK